ncbi:MAG: hypothetical protein FJ029_08435, partial [Actinobacteria bacterium]|nr:hypothetical protein [Actinomycetota bacterium]
MRATRFEPLVGVVCLAGAIFAVYSRLIFEGLVPAGYDTQTYFFPAWSYTWSALQAERIPLWNPYLFMGAPFLANPQMAVLYPLNWILLPLSPERALGVALVLHVAIAAAGMAALARGVLRSTWPAATAAGAVFALGGFFAGQSGHVNQVSAAAWLPWVVLALDQILRGGWRRWAPAPVFVALMLLAGHPQEAYIGLAVALPYAVLTGIHVHAGRGAWRWFRGALTGGLVWTAALLGGVLLAAAQLLPAIELAGLSIRSGGLSLGEAAAFALPASEALGGLLPPFRELPSSTEYLAHIGLVGAALAALGVATRGRSPVMWFLLAVALLSVVVSFGPDAKLFTAAYRLMPGFGAFRVPARWLLVLVFAGALLAAYGTDALSASRRTSRRTLVTQGARWGVGLGLLAIAGLAGAAVSRPLGEGVGLAWALAGLGALALLAPLLVLPGPRLRWVAPLAVAVELVVASALTPARAPVPASAYAATGDVLATVRRLAGDGRVLGLADPAFEVSDRQRAALAATYRDTLGDASFREMLVTLKQREILAPNLGLAYGLPLADGYDGGVLPLRTYSELRDALLPGAGAQPDVLIANLVETIPADRVLNALGVQVVLRNNRQVISVGPATLDLEFHVPVGDPLEWHGLNLAGVTGVAILATSAGSAQAGPAGAIALDDGRGGVREVRLERRPGRPERVVVGDGHLVSARLGLDQAAFFSTA